MMNSALSLPIDDVLDEICTALRSNNRLILAAPPGAGKTTRVPLTLLNEDWAKTGKIFVLEPRRIAARAAANRMAQTLGEKVGETVGLRARLDVRTSDKTRIEVITEGVFTRMILDDPELSGISAILFDEFHERSLDADLGLTLAIEAQEALREDLRICPMSATLDTQGLQTFLDAPVVQSDGRAHPVETIYLDRNTSDRIEDQTARAILKALKEETGSILAFLPGAAEIKRTADRLTSLPENTLITPLYGGLSSSEQDAAIRPATKGQRKVVLATDIAESSLTIDGVRIVVDAGLARVPKYDAALGASRLQTIRASLANADQRRGRAGRTEAGVCYRLWNEAETNGLPKFPSPEISNTDLTGLAIDLAKWGTTDPDQMRWLDIPPKGVWTASTDQLKEIGALDIEGKLTTFGHKLSKLPLPPRLAAMVLKAGETDAAPLAAQIAALMSERGLGGRSIDARERLARFQTDKSRRSKSMMDLSKRWAKAGGNGSFQHNREDAGRIIATGFPDRIAKARAGKPGEFLMSNGRAVLVDSHDPLAMEPWLAIADLTGGGPILRATLAAPLSEIEAKEIGQLETIETANYDDKLKRITAREVTRLGAIVLNDKPLQKPKGKIAEKALLYAVEKYGLELLDNFISIQNISSRIKFLCENNIIELIENIDKIIIQCTDQWLKPLLENQTNFSNLSAQHLEQAIKSLLDWQQIRDLDLHAPRQWTTPTGRPVPIIYDEEKGPIVSVKAQEFFGLSIHPSIANGKVPLTLELLSPAQRPIAMTKDIVSFWTGGYQDMRKDMRGRYPKHDWPEDPANAKPQRGTKNSRR